MSRHYFSSRTNKKEISLGELHQRVDSLFKHFHQLDYFKQKLGIDSNDKATKADTLAHVLLGFYPFPISKWQPKENPTDVEIRDFELLIFDLLEFLFDHISEPRDWGEMVTDTGWQYSDYRYYDEKAGKTKFLEMANVFLRDYGVGFELSFDGTILAIGNDGLESILNAEIIEYNETSVDNKVRDAILKWRNRSLSWDLRREAIREMADVFEWLQKNEDLEKVIKPKDSSVLFNIANNFAIRHHEPKQQSNYEKEIWYPWMFHFYLATYHATIRLLKKHKTP